MKRALAGLALAAASAAALPAQRSVDAYGIVTTHHQVTVQGRVLRYTARTGLMPIRDNDAGDVHAQMFFVSYTLDRAPGAPPRPLTFLWNGGPGSNAGLVHLLGFGPKRVTRMERGLRQLSPAGTALVDNEDTWLAFTDLVFVDPVGTGYSRPASTAYEPEFFTPRGDAESVAEFIRVYRTRYDAFAAPLFLVGESYGVTRAALVANALVQRHADLRGAVLLSLALPLGTASSAWKEARLVPSFTAAAWYNHMLAPDLQRDLGAALAASETWTKEVYAPALARRDSLTPAQRDGIIAQLARFTGLPAERIDTGTLVVGMQQFGDQLLAKDGRVVGHYDTRMTGARDSTQRIYDPTTDPSLKDILDAVSVLRYIRTELGFSSDLFYQGPFGGGYPPPPDFRGDWMSVRWSKVMLADSARRGAAKGGDWSIGADSLAAAALASALAGDSALKVISVCGRFDLACAYFGNETAVRALPAAQSARVQVFTYNGGHAVYTDRMARRELARDARQFFEANGKAAPAPAPRSAPPETSMSTTHHAITVHGAPMAYTARAGVLPIRDNRTGETQGNVFFVSYSLDRKPGAPPRPITFLWNGGPGANALFVHLVGFGPRRIKSADDPAHPVRVAEALEDNEATWLAFSDLVFVDPVGTGFSRAAKPEYSSDFYGTNEDIASVAEFVRVYRTHFDLFGAPLYLAGESYGAWRAAGVAEHLERRGQRVSGVILISGGVGLGQPVSGAYRTALLVPGRVATALYHKRLAPELQADSAGTMRAATEWAVKVYAPALARRDSLTAAEREAIVAQLARFSAIDPDSIDRKTLAITAPRFRALLLGDPHKTLGRYDMRLVGTWVEPDHARLVTSYLRYDLRYYTDLAYADEETGWWGGPPDSAHGPAERWAWDQGAPLPGPPEIDPDAPPPVTGGGVGTGDGPPGGAQPWLRRAMRIDPALKAFVAAGLYDSLNGCADNEYVVTHVSPKYGSRYTLECYAGGHMMYDVASERRKLQRDVAAFVAATSGAR